MRNKLAPTESATNLIRVCKDYGWTYEVRGSILTIRKRITPGSNESFAKADSEYWDILSWLPTVGPGSIWGTDGGGMGAMTAMNTGRMEMHKSGGSKRVLKALARMV